VLITVLSVFNGFQREVRTRMLSAVAHVQISGLGESLRDWQSVAAIAAKHPHVVATAPYVSAQGLLTMRRQCPRRVFARHRSRPGR